MEEDIRETERGERREEREEEESGEARVHPLWGCSSSRSSSSVLYTMDCV